MILFIQRSKGYILIVLTFGYKIFTLGSTFGELAKRQNRPRQNPDVVRSTAQTTKYVVTKCLHNQDTLFGPLYTNNHTNPFTERGTGAD